MSRPPLCLPLFAAILWTLAPAGAQTNNGPFANVSIRHSQALLLWSQSITPGSSTRYPSAKFYDFNYVRNLPDTTLHPKLIPETTQKLNQSYGPTTNRHVAVTTGDFLGTGHYRYVAAWENAGKVNVFMPDINESQLQYNTSNVPTALDNLTLLAGTPENLRSIQLATGKFTVTNHDQFVLAYAASDDTIRLRTYDTGGNGSLTPVKFAAGGDEPISATASYVPQFAIATGHITSQTSSQVVLAGVDAAAHGIFVKVYEVGTTGLKAVGRVPIRPLPSPVYDVNLAVATGDFNGDGYDEIALAYTFFTQDNGQNTVDSSYVVILKTTHPAPTSLTFSSTSFRAFTPSQTGNHTIAIAAGNVYSPDTAAIVVGTSDGYNLLYSTDGSLTPTFITTLRNTNPVVSPQGPLAISGNAAIAVGYLQTTFNNSRPSIVTVEDLMNSNGDLETFRITSFTADPTDPANRRWDTNTSVTFSSDSAAYGGNNDSRGFALALGDFDRRIQYLGTPRHTQPTVFHPTFIVDVPPTHYDIINGTTYDLNGIYPTYPPPPSPFNSTYTVQSSTDSVGGTTIQSGWDASAEIKAGKDFGVVNIQASVSTAYAQSTSTNVTKSYSTSYTSSSPASTDDWLYGTKTGYDLWEYPYYRNDTLKGYVTIVVPNSPVSVFQPLKGANFDYAARHEVGNLMSYMGRTTLLADPSIKTLFFTTATSVTISQGSAGNNGSLNWNAITTALKTDSSGLNVGASAGGGGFGIDLKVSGNYSADQIHTVTSTVSSSTTMSYNFGGVPNRQDANYTVTPLWYWAKNGALVLDYAVDIDISSQTGAFWKTNYGTHADPGFILPYKFDRQKGDTTLSTQSLQFETPSIQLFPSHPAAGDTALLFARINNFSLVDIPPGNIHVRFYNEDPASGGTIIRGTNGDTVVSTILLSARGQEVAQLNWRVATLPKGRIFAKITYDSTELRTDNNVGFNIFSYLAQGATSVQSERAPLAFSLSQNYPNPFNPSTNLEFKIAERVPVRLIVYDILGREVATLVNEVRSPGTYTVRFEGSRFASGVYMYRLTAGAFSQVRKMLLIK